MRLLNFIDQNDNAIAVVQVKKPNRKAFLNPLKLQASINLPTTRTKVKKIGYDDPGCLADCDIKIL